MRTAKSIGFSAVMALVASARLLGDAPSEDGALRAAVFEEVWGIVNKAYYDATFGGLDWNEIGEHYRARLGELSADQELRMLLSEMVNELGESHFAIFDGSWDEASRGRWSGGDAGIELTLAGDSVIVFRAAENSAAEEAGLEPGYGIHSIFGSDVSEIRAKLGSMNLPPYMQRAMLLYKLESLLNGSVGESLLLQASLNGGAIHDYSIQLRAYQGLMSRRLGHINPVPLNFEASWLGDDIAYLRFNLWFPALMEDLRTFIQSLQGKAKGLIIDLRGNRGGIGFMATGVAGLLIDESLSLGTMQLRSGHLNFVSYPQAKAFLGPVAVLVDASSLSTSEVFAIGLQESGRVRVFGEASSGAALPSQFIELSNGDLFQYPTADFVTPKGVRVEGRGVIPDVEVALSPTSLLAGEDNVQEQARQWMLSLQ